MQQIVPEGSQRAVNMGMLTAFMAELTHKRSGTVEAGGFFGMACCINRNGWNNAPPGCQPSTFSRVVSVVAITPVP
jgi:hypothetical protein